MNEKIVLELINIQTAIYVNTTSNYKIAQAIHALAFVITIASFALCFAITHHR